MEKRVADLLEALQPNAQKNVPRSNFQHAYIFPREKKASSQLQHSALACP
jgi:hypothetical protein